MCVFLFNEHVADVVGKLFIFPLPPISFFFGSVSVFDLGFCKKITTQVSVVESDE